MLAPLGDYQIDLFNVETAGCGPQRHFLDLGLDAIEHENESRCLPVRNVELWALISVDIQEKSGAAWVPIASVIHDEGVLPNVSGLHQRFLLILVGEISNARDLRILPTAAVHDQLGILRLR
jgi:hypothetical protein